MSTIEATRLSRPHVEMGSDHLMSGCVVSAKRFQFANVLPGSESTQKNQEEERYILRLYVAGATPASRRAIENVTAFCERWLKGRYELNVVDIYQQPESIQDLEIIAVPTLVKLMPFPLRKLIGDMSQAEKVLLGLGIGPPKG